MSIGRGVVINVNSMGIYKWIKRNGEQKKKSFIDLCLKNTKLGLQEGINELKELKLMEEKKGMLKIIK